MLTSFARLVGPVLAQSSDPADGVTQAVESAQITGWSVAFAVTVLVLAYPAARLARRLARRTVGKVPNVPEILVLDVGRLTYWATWLVAAGIALSVLGIAVGWFTIAVVAGLVLLILMIRPIIESMAAGLVLTMRPAFVIGDEIDVEGLRGTVLDIGTRATQLKTSDGVRIYLPNTQLLNQTIKVLTAFDNRRTQLDVVLARGVDLDAAAKVIENATTQAEGVSADPGPTVQASSFQPNGITFTVEYWYPSSETGDGTVTDKVIRAVDKALIDNSIAVAEPLVQIAEPPHTASTPTADPTEEPAETDSSKDSSP